MNDKTKLNEWFYSSDDGLGCCGEFQYKTYCYAHDEYQGCYYCEFDYSKPCECED